MKAALGLSAPLTWTRRGSSNSDGLVRAASWPASYSAASSTETSRPGAPSRTRRRTASTARSPRRTSVPVTSTTGPGSTSCQVRARALRAATAAACHARPSNGDAAGRAPGVLARTRHPQPAVAGPDRHVPVPVGAGHQGTDVVEQRERGGGRVAVVVVGPGADDGQPGGEQVVQGRVLVCRPVVGDLEDVDRGLTTPCLLYTS